MTNVAEHITQELWFLTGSQHLYGEETLNKVAQNSQQIADALGSLWEAAGQGRVEASADRARANPRRMPGG